MIRYRLICDKEHEFDGWFRSSSDFDEQAAAGDVICPQCASAKVRKGLMAPSIPRKGNTKPEAPGKTRAGAEIAENVTLMMSELRRHVETNYDYVGDKFAEEARRMHYEETPRRDIYGETTLDEARELIEEGVEVAPLPGLEKRKTN
jgi:hypothetical protein